MRRDQLQDIVALGLDADTLQKLLAILNLKLKSSERQQRWRVRRRLQSTSTVTSTVASTKTSTLGTIGVLSFSQELLKKESKRGVARELKVVDSDEDTPEELFDQLWKFWPKRQGSDPKKPAKLKFLRLIKAGVDPNDIADGLAAMLQQLERDGTEPRFFPQMITWLNQERWTDGQEIAGEPVEERHVQVNGHGAANGRYR